jgi:putative endonuclease
MPNDLLFLLRRHIASGYEYHRVVAFVVPALFISAMPWYLYLLECKGGRIYAGISNDVAARYAAHVSGKGAKFTCAFPPTQILAVFEYPDRSTASKAEARVKAMRAERKRALCLQSEAP